jgi:DNA-binding response OmpR family regulator
MLRDASALRQSPGPLTVAVETPRILVVEDCVALTRLLNQLLMNCGFMCELANTGQEGIQLFRRRPADLVLTDIYLPDIDGRELIRQIRETGSQVDIIAMTGSEERRDPLLEALRLGAVRTFRKPFDTEELLLCIREILNPARRRQSPQ